jgi:hypothetical protein
MMLLCTIVAIIVGLVVWAAIDAPNNLQIDHQNSQRERLG